MKKEIYSLLENYMLSCMEDSAHDKEHVYRVLYTALDIARTQKDVDYDILISACLLHDIGRKEQFENPALCHALVGADKAYRFLIENDFTEEFAVRVKECIQSHRYRNTHLPQSIEAKILFDADKIDVCGAIGIARTLVYKGKVSEPLYSLLPNGQVSEGTNDSQPSFFQEYKYKLETIYDRFFTKRGQEIGKERQEAAVSYYQNMLREVSSAYQYGGELLKEYIE